MFTKVKIKSFFFQLFTIAAGVYLGVIGGNWNDSRKSREAQAVFLDNISMEIRANLKNMEMSLRKHEAMKISMEKLMETVDEEFLNQKFLANDGFQMIDEWQGFGVNKPNQNVFKTGLNTNVFSELDFEISSLISGIYSRFDGYTEFTDSILDRALFELNPDTKTQDVFFIIELITTDVLSNERRLLDKVNKSIEKLEKLKK